MHICALNTYKEVRATLHTTQVYLTTQDLFPNATVALSLHIETVFSQRAMQRDPLWHPKPSSVCSLLLCTHTCALSVTLLSEPRTCSSGEAQQEHKQRGINIYDSISLWLDVQLSSQLKNTVLWPVQGQERAAHRYRRRWLVWCFVGYT